MDENIIPLIQDVASQFQRSGSDLKNIQKTIQDIRETEKVRREALQDTRSLLQKMSRDLQLSRSKGSREHVDPDSINHESYIQSLDSKTFSIAKVIQDMDQDIASLEAEVHQLRMQSLELDSSHKSGLTPNGKNASSNENGIVQDGEVALDDVEDILDDTAHATAVLRLQLYRGLGVEMLENDLGIYSKARVHPLSLPRCGLF
ncbi:hypothetical protein BGX21_007613 [Mortierella sp. AD011]|nr:hypothetical protein BGX20_011549 [Mortierella sp. AD010]KAF9403004.1 hypothetical protein BGX21_007613 [Mortierella sp. AD011]